MTLNEWIYVWWNPAFPLLGLELKTAEIELDLFANDLGGLESFSGPMASAGAGANARPVAKDDAPRIDASEAKVSLRSFFPETWLFTLALVNDGSTNLLRYFLMVVVVPVVLESSCTVSAA